MEWADMITAAACFGGAYAGASVEVRKLRAQLQRIARIVAGCPHHQQGVL